MHKSTSTVKDYQRAVGARLHSTCILHLYIAGSTPRSLQAVRNIKKICQENLPDMYELKIFDIFQQPLLAKAEQIFAVPALIKKLPAPRRLIIGDMSDTAAIIANIGC